MTIEWSDVFEAFGIKTVSHTDKSKAAFVPNAEQRNAIELAGIQPSNSRPAPGFPITVLCDPKTSTVQASYYNSLRVGSARTPEARMGHGFISSWLKEDDEVVLGFLDGKLFAAKTTQANNSPENVLTQLAVHAPQAVLNRAKRATGKPARREVKRQDFVRDPFVVEAAKIRARGQCEMPSCQRPLFLKEDKTRYLEVHHMIPLSEGGDDTLANAAALCPHCHRELHLGADRMQLRTMLQSYIATIVI